MNRVDKTISYFKNGIDLGVAFHNVLEEQLFPCIGMQTHEEEVMTFLIPNRFHADAARALTRG